MNSVLIFLVIFVNLELVTTVDWEFYLDTPEVIRSWGYPDETHDVTTQDGFILQLHRIPNPNRPVIFLQHAFLSSSFDWVCNSPGQSAGFVFFDAGFDVWMGNWRGNTYSRRHASLDPDEDKEFWDWSIDHHSKFDLPAMINHTLTHTNRENLYYVGHSLGTLAIFQKLSVDQKFGAKIAKIFALAPVGALHHMRGAFSYASRYFGQEIQDLNRKYGPAQFFGASKGLKLIVKYTCGLYTSVEELCSDIVMMFVGPTSDGTWNQTRVPIYMAHSPAGSSSNVLEHFNQMVSYGGVPYYDMGPERNLEVYGTYLPPAYDYSKIADVEVYLFWSEDDWLSTKEDVEGFLVPKLAKVVRGNFRVSNYNHLHFVWGTKAYLDVYRPIIDLINEDL
ncbi:unnamed protein product [Caenorhabditis angaria]|uniref:Lipase n=1 Tax=Caenorhabditis angaria TaxID=860376 RepID=A0A9P1N6Y1_9PELO|nr:unnamed protein product [Caenorhabditis angaria]